MVSWSHQSIELPITGPCLSSEEDFLAQYTIKEAIGKGGYAQVNLAYHKVTGIPVAVKVLKKEKQSHQQIRSEVEVMKRTSHPNIITLIQVIETDQNVYLAMELIQGRTLYQNINEYGCLKEHTARDIFCQLLSALCYCHELGIAHGDIKPDNIMVTFNGRVKLIDFGMSMTFNPGEMLECVGGLHEYNPPEVYFKGSCDASKVDVWRLGVTLYFTVTGTMPFQTNNPLKLVYNVLRGTYNIPFHLSEGLRSLISKILTASPNQRPTVKIIMGHPWLNQDSTRSHSNDTISQVPDPKIMAALASIGIQTEDVKDALLHQKYNETLAMYKIFQLQASQRENISIITEPVDPGVTPCPSPSYPATFPLSFKWTGSMPDLESSSSNYGQEARMRTVRTTPMPSVSLCCKQSNISLNTALQKLLTAPCTLIAHSHKDDQEEVKMPQRIVKEDGPLCTEALPVSSATSEGRPGNRINTVRLHVIHQYQKGPIGRVIRDYEDEEEKVYLERELARGKSAQDKINDYGYPSEKVVKQIFHLLLKSQILLP
uniref:sperm motility kinase Z-like n=1 Tax=Jaculus jaculus TaxID=51337 RepID=UPI001E1B12EE|nr:sperm motility kinase Z-like [Jaculus jaculus]